MAQTETAISQATFLRDQMQRLDHTTLRTIQPGMLMSQDFFREPPLMGWMEALDFRLQVLELMQYSRSVSALAPLAGDIPDGQVRAKCPELFKKLVDLSRAMESVDTIISATGDIGDMTAEIMTNVTHQIEATPQKLVGKWTQRILDETIKDDEREFFRKKYLAEHQDKFYPPGASEEELSVYARGDPEFNSQLPYLHATLKQYDKQTTMELELCMNGLQIQAAKLSIAVVQRPVVSSLSLNMLLVDRSVFAALKAIRVGIARAQALSEKELPSIERSAALKRHVTEAGAFYTEGADNFAERLAKMLGIGLEMIKDVTPAWRPYVLEKPQPEKIKTEWVESTVSADIRVAYPILVSLLCDVQATDTDLELRLKLKHADTFESMEKALAEAKLTLVVEHTCNVIHILGPKAGSPLEN